MLISVVIVSLLLLVVNIFLWKTAHSGIAFFFLVYKNEEDKNKLIKLTNTALAVGVISCLYVIGMITWLIMI